MRGCNGFLCAAAVCARSNHACIPTRLKSCGKLDVVGVRALDDLFADIPASMRPRRFDLPKGRSEAARVRLF